MTTLFILMPPRKLSLWYVSWCDYSPSSFSAFFWILASCEGFHVFLGVFLIFASCAGFATILSRHTSGFLGLVRVFPEVVLLFLLIFIYFSFSPLFALGLFHRIHALNIVDQSFEFYRNLIFYLEAHWFLFKNHNLSLLVRIIFTVFSFIIVIGTLHCSIIIILFFYGRETNKN